MDTSNHTPLSWEEITNNLDGVKKQGIRQFIYQYKKHKDRRNDPLYWGDEIEYMIVKIDDEEKTTKLCLKAKDVLETLNIRNIGNRTPIWTPEFGAYMVESIPERPYSDLLYSISEVELSMKERRKELTSVLEEDEIPFTLPSYPRLGVGCFAVPSTERNPNNVTSKPWFSPDDVIYKGRQRTTSIHQNIKDRKGGKIEILIPVYQDIKTKLAFPAVIKTKWKMEQSNDNSIFMEGLVFGAGCCGLQTTFQMDNLDEARFLYDQLVNICPIMLALSAASPVHRGYLSDIDTRWPVLSQSFDDRTDEEKGQKPLKNDRFRIQKSRWSSVETYICPEHSQYNNTDIVYDKDSYEELKNEGLDEALSKHIAYLFIRDPLFLCSETLDQDEILDIQHLENINSTNWQTLRLKLPICNTSTGWRVEFRPMEIQLSDFENAAYAVFVFLVTRIVIAYRLNFVIPISKVDENMSAASKRDAVMEEKFYFRRNSFSDKSITEIKITKPGQLKTKDGNDFCQMTIDEIINGNVEFPGLIPLIKTYLESKCEDTDEETNHLTNSYLKLISDRASGAEPTTANFIRNFVTTHPYYQQDSIVSDIINYELLKACAKKSNGGIK
ncbi:glutamate--cysteine ligase catalytic subunit-like [Mytilus galloprovincialis]|uniref:glutamate--cysteine ligase catalytic subunit-like n=1 Tax=Mytilus galloprovincialis TaxID=29158 RepID=UPI003F7C854F